MDAGEAGRAIAAARSVAASLHLAANDVDVLNNSNKLTVRLLPAGLVARIGPAAEQGAAFEFDIAQRLADAGCPVAAPDPRVEPRVHECDGFEITLWTYYPPGTEYDLAPPEYADALERLHAGMRTVDVSSPHVTDRVGSARRLLADRERTPALPDQDRSLLESTLQRLGSDVARRGREQLLHGEPHPGNVLSTSSGPVVIDFETCCRGPVEFDLAHAPGDVARHYPGADLDLVEDCRTLMLAMVTTWRWDRDDQLPGGRRLGHEWFRQLRSRQLSAP